LKRNWRNNEFSRKIDFVGTLNRIWTSAFGRTLPDDEPALSTQSSHSCSLKLKICNIELHQFSFITENKDLVAICNNLMLHHTIKANKSWAN